MSTNQKYVVSHLDRQSGPFDEKELRGKWDKGELLPIDYVYNESKHDWVLIAELFPWALAKKTNSAAPEVKKSEPPPVTLKPLPSEKLNIPPMIEAVANTQPVTPSLPSPTPVVAPAPAPSQPGAKVEFRNGVGELDLSTLHPGRIELRIQEAPTKLSLAEPFQIHVRPADPVELVFNFPESQTVGESITVNIRALDERGQVCIGHTDPYVLQVRGSVSQDVDVKMKDGQGTVTISHTKAERWNLTLQNPHSRELRLPQSRSLEWNPGPAARLILDGPNEYVAGSQVKMRVKAVDTYGNLANSFQGTVVLEVKAS